MDGPALVVEHETTVVLPAGWQAQTDSHGHLRMEIAP
jgi:N-methylhydantoinase A/oxoprolinase/acetone carboxylase beta subunit